MRYTSEQLDGVEQNQPWSNQRCQKGLWVEDSDK